MTIVTDRRYTLCRAYPQVRPSGMRYSWRVLTLDGGTVAGSASGTERHKGEAIKLARAEAKRINAALPRCDRGHK